MDPRRLDIKTPANTSSALSAFSEPREPVTVARFNGHEVMVAKTRGAYPWHKHEDMDELFLVLKGQLTIEMLDRSEGLGPGDLFVVPRGVELRPVAEDEAHLLLIEPPGTAEGGTTVL